MNFGIKRIVAAVKAASVFSQMYCGKPVSIRDISSVCGLSPSYLEQIFSNFVKAKIVTSIRGPGGGYHLEKKDLTVSDVVKAVSSSASNEFFIPVLAALESVPVSTLNKVES